MATTRTDTRTSNSDTRTAEPGSTLLRRRGVIAGAALALGLAVERSAAPVRAANITDNNFTAFGGSGTAFSVESGGYTIGVNGSGSLYGVHGHSTSSSGNGVYGTGSGHAVYGRTNAAADTGFAGVVGDNGTFGNGGVGNYGVYGFGGVGSGVAGGATSGVGVGGDATSGIGVQGTCTTGGYAVVGRAGVGAVAALYGSSSTPNTPAFYAVNYAAPNPPNSNAGFFIGQVYINGPLVIAGGAKSAAVPHPDGTHRLLYCVESPEAWFEDFGEGTITGGKAEIKLDPDFGAVVDTRKLHVFLTPHDEHHALHLTGRSATGFTVGAVPSTTGAVAGKKVSDLSGTFTWRVVAKRKDVAAPRLAKFEPPKMPPPPSTSLAEKKPVPPAPVPVPGEKPKA